MRIDTHAINVFLSREMKQYAETRMWQAARHWARRVSWVGLWLINDPEQPEAARYCCRLDAWVRGVGIVSVRHLDSNAYVAIDIAAARLEQALAGKIRRLTRRAYRAAAGPRLSSLDTPPRVAVVLERGGPPRRLSLMPWLRTKYGIEQISRVSLSAAAWRAAAEGADDGAALREQLRLAMACEPELIVVLGRPAGADDETAMRAEQEQVHRIVGRLRDWQIGVETVGLWIAETWQPECCIESMELTRCTPDHDAIDAEHAGAYRTKYTLMYE